MSLPVARATTHSGSCFTSDSGIRASPREAITATNKAITPSRATTSSDWMNPNTRAARNDAARRQELSCPGIRVGLHT